MREEAVGHRLYKKVERRTTVCIDNYSMIVLPCVTAENEASLLQAETQSSLQKLLVARSIAVVSDPASVICIFEKLRSYL